MSELFFLTLGAVAVFLILLVPGNYLVSLFWERDPSNRPSLQTHLLMQNSVLQSTTHGVLPKQIKGTFQDAAKTNANQIELLVVT
jgi:hypothetical protein